MMRGLAHEQPAFLYLAYGAVHVPLSSPRAAQDARGVSDRLRERDPRRARYLGALGQLDRGFERLMAALRELDRAPHTFVLVSSDNGGPLPARVAPDSDYNGARNVPFRGGKHNVLEGGIRARAFVWMGERITGQEVREAGSAGGSLQRFQNPIHVVDWLPTFIEIAGWRLQRRSRHWQRIDEDADLGLVGKLAGPLDGVSLASALRLRKFNVTSSAHPALDVRSHHHGILLHAQFAGRDKLGGDLTFALRLGAYKLIVSQSWRALMVQPLVPATAWPNSSSGYWWGMPSRRRQGKRHAQANASRAGLLPCAVCSLDAFAGGLSSRPCALLFHLPSDPSEMRNLAIENRTTTTHLCERLASTLSSGMR